MEGKWPWIKWYKIFAEFNLLLIFSCMQFWFVIPKYLNSATFLKDLLVIFSYDEHIHFFFVFTSRPTLISD